MVMALGAPFRDPDLGAFGNLELCYAGFLCSASVDRVALLFSPLLPSRNLYPIRTGVLL